MLNEIIEEEQPSEVLLTLSSFWLRIDDLPFNYRSKEDIKVIV